MSVSSVSEFHVSVSSASEYSLSEFKVLEYSLSESNVLDSTVSESNVSGLVCQILLRVLSVRVHCFKVRCTRF